MKGQRGSRIVLYSFFNLGARWGWWSTPRPSRFTPQERDPVQILQEAGWSSVPIEQIVYVINKK